MVLLELHNPPGGEKLFGCIKIQQKLCVIRLQVYAEQ